MGSSLWGRLPLAAGLRAQMRQALSGLQRYTLFQQGSVQRLL